MKIGYARVSTQDQRLNIQLEALKKAGCKRVFREKARPIGPLHSQPAGKLVEHPVQLRPVSIRSGNIPNG
jgi:hypothetical protein